MITRFVLSFVLSLSVWSNVEARVISTPDTEAIRAYVISESRRHGVPPSLALAVAHVESTFRPHVVSHAGAVGVMQIMPATARGEFGVSRQKLFDAKTNITLGVRFLKHLHSVYRRWDIALSHYNGGSAVRRPDGRLRVIPATRGYVQKVMRLEQDYARHLGSMATRLAAKTSPPLRTSGVQAFQVTSKSRRQSAVTDMNAALADLAMLMQDIR